MKRDMGELRARPTDAGAMRPLCVTVNEAASLIGIGRTKLYALISSGDIKAIRLGGCTRITTESLIDYFERCPSIFSGNNEKI